MGTVVMEEVTTTNVAVDIILVTDKTTKVTIVT